MWPMVLFAEQAPLRFAQVQFTQASWGDSESDVVSTMSDGDPATVLQRTSAGIFASVTERSRFPIFRRMAAANAHRDLRKAIQTPLLRARLLFPRRRRLSEGRDDSAS